jgi:hypothetical protein
VDYHRCSAGRGVRGRKTVKIEIIRDRAKRTVDVKIAEATEGPAAATPSPTRER